MRSPQGCQAINQLEQQHLANISTPTLFNTRLQKEKAKLLNVIGDDYNLYCKLNCYYCKFLLNTGGQVSLLSKDLLEKNISKFEILDLMELLDDGTKFRIQWGNSPNIQFVGWVNQEIQLESSDTTLSNMPTPCDVRLHRKANFRFDVIKEMLQDNQQKDALVKILTKSFGKSSKAQTIFKSMRQENQSELVYNKKWMRVPANTSITASCKANMGMLDLSHH